ncbi:MAG: ArsR/SmtB family transcription factor [Actinomycetota bacterium]
MRVVNLSQRPQAIALEVVQSTAAELLMSILALGDLLGLTKDVNTYDMGKERLEELRNQASDDLLEDIEALFGGPGTLGESCGKLLANLFGYVIESGPDYDVDTFLANLEASEPIDLLLALVGYHTRHPVAAPGVIRRAVEGDAAARTEFVEGARDRWGAKDGMVLAQEHVLEQGPERVQSGLVVALRRWDKEVFAQYKDEALPVLERDYRAKLKMSQELSLERTIELATNGIQFAAEPWIRTVVMAPTYILRPWVLLTDHRDTSVYVYPVSDDSLGVDESVPPPQLVKLYKALGDANRLKLLRRLASGPMTLKEATDLLGSAKSTAFHHLAILRQAGLLWVREDEDKTYTLREDLIPQASELLQGYLRIGPGSGLENVTRIAPR